MLLTVIVGAWAAGAQEAPTANADQPAPKVSSEAAPEDAEDNDSPQETAEERRRRLRRQLGGMSKLSLAGHDLSVGFAELDRGGPDWQALEQSADGSVFQFTRGQAIKLKTAASLRFGELVVKKENVAAGYPGVYSLWLKKAGAGWRLVFNEEPDVWGTMHDPKKDVGEVALDYAAADAEAASFKVELTAMGEGGLLRMAWGPHQWSVPFELAE